MKIFKVIPLLCLAILSSCLNGDGESLFTQPIIKPTADITFESSLLDTGDAFVGDPIDHTSEIVVSGGAAATGITASITGSTFITFKDGSFPGTGGSCQTTMEAQTCTIVLSYNPQDFSTHNSVLTLSFNNGKEDVSRSVDLLGETVAILLIDEEPIYNFGNITIGTSVTKSFTVTHRGVNPASSISNVALSAPFTFEGGSFPGTGGDCGPDMSNGETCTIVVRYTPTDRETSSDFLRLDYFNGISTEFTAREIRGRGMAPAELSISPATTNDFGLTANGSNTYLTFNINYDDGDQPASSIAVNTGLSAPFSFRGGSFPGTGGNCTSTLSSGSCTVVVQFSPLATNSYSDSFTIEYFDALNTQTMSQTVQGESQPPATLSINRSGTYDFGTVQTGNSVDVVYTVTYDSGGVDATGLTAYGLAAPFSFKGGNFPGSGGTCSSTLGSGTCTIVLTYAPTSSGNFSDTMVFRYNNGVSALNITRDIQGNTEAELAFSSSSTFPFGNVLAGLSDEATFNVENIGGSNATSVTGSGLNAPFSFKGGSYPGTGGDCSTTITAGDTCTVVIVFSPTTSVVTFTDTVLINYFDGFQVQTTSRLITGIGTAPATLVINGGTTYNFGDVALTDTAEVTLTVDFNGNAFATGTTGSGLSAPFAFKGGSFPGTGGDCGPIISIDCTIVLTYTPTASTTHIDTIEIDFNDGVNAQTATLDLNGRGRTVAVLTISETDNYDYGNVTTNSTAEHTFTVSHSGELSATGVTGAGISAPFAFKGVSYPGTGGDCGSTISTDCSIVVTFNPTTAVTSLDTIELNYDDGKDAQSITRGITGTGVAPAAITVSSHQLSFGKLSTGSTQGLFLAVMNEGDSPASNFHGSNSTETIIILSKEDLKNSNDECGYELLPGESCKLQVELTADRVGKLNDQINLNYFDGSKKTHLTLQTEAESILNIQSQNLFNLLAPHEINTSYSNFQKLGKINKNKALIIDDITQDDIPDLLALSSTGVIEAKNARSFSTIYEVPTDKSRLNQIELLNDADQDGYNDFVVGSPLSENTNGTISFYSSYYGDKRFEIVGNLRNYLGLSIHNIGDLNGDQIDDLIFGEYESKNNKVILKKLHAIDGLYGEWLFELEKHKD